MHLQEIQADKTLVLRHTLLRPNLSPEKCIFPGDTDAASRHFGSYRNRELVGIVSVYRKSNQDVYNGCGYQLRGIATSESVRGTGIGRQLLRAAEQAVFDAGADYIWANARVTAVGFYEKAGYTIGRKEFNVVGVGPHVLAYRLCN